MCKKSSSLFLSHSQPSVCMSVCERRILKIRKCIAEFFPTYRCISVQRHTHFHFRIERASERATLEIKKWKNTTKTKRAWLCVLTARQSNWTFVLCCLCSSHRIFLLIAPSRVFYSILHIKFSHSDFEIKVATTRIEYEIGLKQ